MRERGYVPLRQHDRPRCFGAIEALGAFLRSSLRQYTSSIRPCHRVTIGRTFANSTTCGSGERRVTDWFYAHNGVRSGPFPADEMRRLAQVGTITDDTLCWCNKFGTEWKPCSQTELYISPSVDQALPPPLPVTQIRNVYAWIYAFVPLIGAVIEEAFAQNGAAFGPTYLWIPYVISYGVLAGLDSRMIARSGNLPKGRLPNVWWFILAPVYLWKRASYLKQRKSYFWTWIVCFVIGIVFQASGVSNGLFVAGIPKCESAYATTEAMSLFDKLDVMIKRNTKALNINMPKETDVTTSGSEVTSRTCSATIKGTDDNDHLIIYKFDEENGQVYVHLHVQ